MSAVALGHMPLGILDLSFFYFKFAKFQIYFSKFFITFFLSASPSECLQRSELSQVYPEARGLSPLIILFVSAIFIGDYVSGY